MLKLKQYPQLLIYLSFVHLTIFGLYFSQFFCCDQFYLFKTDNVRQFSNVFGVKYLNPCPFSLLVLLFILAIFPHLFFIMILNMNYCTPTGLATRYRRTRRGDWGGCSSPGAVKIDPFGQKRFCHSGRNDRTLG